MRGGSRFQIVLLFLVLLAACKGRIFRQPDKDQGDELPEGAILVDPKKPDDQGTTPPRPLEPISAGASMPVSFAPLARRADPSVATIKARTYKGRELVEEGLGTGFVYDKGGYLLTNNHVIENATKILVGFPDGNELEAELVGRDKPTDVAVLKVDDKDLPFVPLGDSDALQVGDWVVAIGNPFGLEHTVSAGILSAKGRTRDDVKGLDSEGYFDFLQTDASINPGNSGGPLLNVAGEVVGVNTAVRANANNIGFAIPINMVKQILPMLLKDGKIRRSMLGVDVDTLTRDSIKNLKRPDLKGAWVIRVGEGGPADRAGLLPDDIIVNFDDKQVSDPNDLRWYASIYGVGKTVKLRVARLKEGKSVVFEVDVMLGELPPP